jgi:superfamily II DNA/RNA helicase
LFVRELAKQIISVLEAFLKNLSRPLTAAVLVGGTDINEDIRLINQHGANILVGSPGYNSIFKEISSIGFLLVSSSRRLDYVLQKAGKALNIKTLEVFLLYLGVSTTSA